MERALPPQCHDLPGSARARNWLAFAAALTLCVTIIAGVLVAQAASVNETSFAAGGQSDHAATSTREARF
ncbi:MAG: hypothetical protein ACI9QQ_002763 [Myxococcota bacterium]|jgi:hypothetical protein